MSDITISLAGGWESNFFGFGWMAVKNGNGL